MTVDPLFELLPASKTGVGFANQIATDDSINILTYEYLYNGGGVGVGDFNNDGLPDIFFSGNRVPCELYINLGNSGNIHTGNIHSGNIHSGNTSLEFENITATAGIDTKGIWAYGVSVVDINQDGWQDIYLSVGGMGNSDNFPNKLYINQGTTPGQNPTFEESAEEYGLADAGESVQAVFFDYDRDGDLDMYLLTGGGFEKSAIVPRPILQDGSGRNTDRLYRNDFDEKSGHPYFTNISEEAGINIEGFGLGVSVLDINQDAWPDVYVTNDYLSKDHLYVNNQDGTFTDRVDQYFKHTSHFAMGNDVGDINNDGKPDIVAADMLPEDNFRRKLMSGPLQYDKFYFSVQQGYGYQYMRNTLQLNNGDNSFSEIGQFAGIDKTDWSWAPLLADFDNDGYQDLVISNGFGKDVTDLDFVKFRQTVAGLNPESRRQAMLDSLAIRPGIVVQNYAFKNNGDNTFRKVMAEWGFTKPSLSNGMAYADLDQDGDLDLVVNNINQEAFIYINTLQEKKTPDSKYISIKLAGPDQNRNGVGATVTIMGDSLYQVRYHYPVRGFQSSVEDVIHFGLGKTQKVDSIQVVWGDGSVSTEPNQPANQLITIAYAESRLPGNPNKKPDNTLLRPTKALPFKHTENEFNDFNHQILLPHKLSQEGPGIAVGDVNNDGLEDMYVGGAYRLPGHFMIQNSRGDFNVKPFAEDFESEDMGALFFDADQDDDLDLYVVSGGVEYYEDHPNYQDRLYLNDGKGNFSKDLSALPPLRSSGSCVVAGDYDQDGDLDLFVGSRVTKDKYPQPPRSYLLRNDLGKFTDVTGEFAPQLAEIGMITAALWTDFDNNNTLDLIIVGEAMPISLFSNKKGWLVNITAESGLQDTQGFWNSLVGGDFDNDGDIDYIAGNLGLNGPMKASPEEPVIIHYADFDQNGAIEPLIGYYEYGIINPFPSLDMLTTQMPFLKKHLLYYKTYAATSLTQLVALTGNTAFNTLYCKTLSSSFILNQGNGKFDLIPLPQPAQLGPVYGLLAQDMNADGNLDVLAVGNSYAPEVTYGRYDALKGLTFFGDGKGNFRYLNSMESGFFVEGDAKGIVKVNTVKGPVIVVTQNNDSIQSFQMKNELITERVTARQDEVYASLFIKNGRKRKVELSFGSTYLSQSSRSILINPQVDSILLYNNKGTLSRKLIFNQLTHLQ